MEKLNKTFKINDTINLMGDVYKVIENEGYFLSRDGYNNIIFNKLSLDSENFSEKILGYNERGDFPYCKTLEDLTKLTNALIDEINKKELFYPIESKRGFKIGDNVVITNTFESIFDTYTIAFSALGFKNINENTANVGEIGEIFYICKHEYGNRIILALNLNSGGQCLIDEQGVKKSEMFRKGDVLICNDQYNEKWMFIYSQYRGQKYFHDGAIDLKCGFFDNNPNSGHYLTVLKQPRKPTVEDFEELHKLGYVIENNKIIKKNDMNNNIMEYTVFNGYEIGDYIMVLESGHNNTDHPDYKQPANAGDVIQIDYFDFQISKGKSTGNVVAASKKGHVVYIEISSHAFRKAKLGEINSYLKKHNQFIKLTKNDLIDGEIYVYHHRHIAKYPKGGSIGISDEYYNPNEAWKWTLDIEPATEEQKIWLNQCIKENKFIPKEKALMKKNNSQLEHPGNYKIWIGNNPELSEKVQKKLFKLGYEWEYAKQNVTNTFGVVLFLNKNGYIRFSDDGSISSFFIKKRTEITPQDLGIETSTKEIKEFNDLKFGDHLLVKDDYVNHTEHPKYKKIAHGDDIIQISSFDKEVNTNYIVAISTEGHVLYLERFPHAFMKSTDIKEKYLKKGQYYKYVIDYDDIIIFKWGENGFLDISNKLLDNIDNNTWNFNGKKLTTPTKDEIVWFDECKRKGDFISQEVALERHNNLSHLNKLIIGNTYVGFNKEGKRMIIFRYNKYNPVYDKKNNYQYSIIYSKHIYLDGNEYYRDDYFANEDAIYTIREASRDEKLWLKKCIFENRFIPQEVALYGDEKSLTLNDVKDSNTKNNLKFFDIETPLPPPAMPFNYGYLHGAPSPLSRFADSEPTRSESIKGKPLLISESIYDMYGDLPLETIKSPMQNIYGSIDPYYYRPRKKKTIKNVLNNLISKKEKKPIKIKLERKKKIF